MSILSTCKYLFILSFSFLVFLGHSVLHAQTDTASVDTTAVAKKKDLSGHQLCLGVDAFHPVINHFLGDRNSYEFTADYYMRDEYYLVGEGGWGNVTVNYPDLRYTNSNNFLRLGFNKSVLSRDNPKDWDMMMIGLRLGFSNITRSAASYTISDSVWGNSDSTHGGKNFQAYWVEITGGMRVELLRNFFAGWNIRGKFLMNGRSFNDLSPIYIAGYGKGDKNAVFDFNVYLSYAIRWKRKYIENAINTGKLK